MNSQASRASAAKLTGNFPHLEQLLAERQAECLKAMAEWEEHCYLGPKFRDTSWVCPKCKCLVVRAGIQHKCEESK